MGTRKSLSYAQHQELAARVKEARKLLLDIASRCGRGLGTSSKPYRIASLKPADPDELTSQILALIK